jgi:Domain of unknown function (DUF4126)
MFEALTGVGLAASAGLNAYIPLLALGLFSRYTDLLTLPGGWQWLESGWSIGILAVLLLIEEVADKIPVVDSVNDVVQTVVRPTSGGLAFGAASASDSVTVDDPGTFFGSGQWAPIVAGVVISLVVHGVKATTRPVLNVTTAGVAAPFVSTAEDVTSTVMSVVAIVLPILILVFLFALFGGFVWLRERRQEATNETRPG